MRAQMRFVLGLAGGIDHQEQMAAEIRHHQIVEDAAFVIGELRVALPAGCERQNILRHQPLQRQRRILDLARFGAERNLAHMRNVEQAGAGAGMKVLLQHAGCILHRHVIAGERHHFAAAGEVQRMERGAFQGRIVVARKHHRALAVPGENSPKTCRSPICRCA